MSIANEDASPPFEPVGPARIRSPLRFLTFPRLVLAILFLCVLFKVELSDPDYFWHLKTGEYIAMHRALPDGDPFSFTFQGQPWAPHEWLFQLGLFGVFALAGGAGVKAAVALFGTLSVAIVYRTANRLLERPSSAVLVAVAAFSLLLVWFVPRPHVVSYVFVAICVDLLVGFKYLGEDRRCWMLVPLMIVWTNLHGAFVIGIAVFVALLACEWSTYLVLRSDAMQRQRLMRLSAVVAVAVLATAVNPRGPAAWLFPAKLLEGGAETPLPGEFMSIDFHTLYGKVVLLFVCGFFAVSVYRRTKPDLTETALPLCALFVGFTAARHLPIAVFIVAPFFAVALRDGPANAWFSRVAGTGQSLGNREFWLNAGVLCFVALTLALAAPDEEARAAARLRQFMPVDAAAFVRSHGITGRMFNDFGQGGYLMWHLAPQHVFIDSRGDVYGAAFTTVFLDIQNGKPGWQKAFDAFAIDYVIMLRAAPIRNLLLLRGDFRLVYDDAYNSVLVRDVERFKDLPTVPTE